MTYSVKMVKIGMSMVFENVISHMGLLIAGTQLRLLSVFRKADELAQETSDTLQREENTPADSEELSQVLGLCDPGVAPVVQECVGEGLRLPEVRVNLMDGD
jgi:hypothetical protein